MINRGRPALAAAQQSCQGSCPISTWCGRHQEPLASAERPIQPQAMVRSAGTTIARQNDSSPALLILRAGSAKSVVQTACGAEHISNFYHPGDILNLGALEQGRHHASIVLLSPGGICHIPQSLLQAHLKHNSTLATALLQAAMHELRHAAWLGALLSQASAEERIFSFLYALAQRSSALHTLPIRLQLAMARKDMANHLGLAVATVSRTMARLEHQGFIHCSGRTIALLKETEGRYTFS